MSCDRCNCGCRYNITGLDSQNIVDAMRLKDSNGVCGGCGEPITGRHGFTSFKTASGYSTFHAACTPDADGD